MDLHVMCSAFGLLCYERVSEPVNARGRQVWTHLQSNTTCGHFECHLFKMVAVQEKRHCELHICTKGNLSIARKELK